MQIGIFLICTGNYGIFLQPLIDSIDKYFFIGHQIKIYLFSDKQHNIIKSDRINIVHIPTEHKPFPHPTLHRYYFFTQASHLVKCDFVFYMDVDMLFVNEVDKDILPDNKNDCGLVATLHPGFYRGGGSWCNNKTSLAYTPENERKRYYAGGFQGGITEVYLSVCKKLAYNISEDERRGIMAEWHDESHWNQYLSMTKPKTLTPEYCMVEELNLRKEWGICEFIPKIIALSKKHQEIRYDNL